MKLFDYQQDGVRHLLAPLRCVYLADKPGLGKTIQALTAAKQLGAKSVLVICPAGIVEQWESQLLDFKLHKVVSYDSLSTSPLKAKAKTGWTEPEKKESPAMMKRRAHATEARDRLRAIQWDVVILDEAHYLKTRTSKRTNFVLHPSYGIAGKAQKVILLSGTPVMNRPEELYAVLRTCYPEALHDCPSFQHYAYKFCDAQTGYNNSLDTSGASNLDELASRLTPFLLSRDEGVLGDKFPALTLVDEPFKLEAGLDDDEHVATRRRQTGEAKTEILIPRIVQLAKEVERLVVFYYHDAVRCQLQRAFPHAPVIKGGLTASQKSQAVDRFTRLGSASVMLVQLTAGGVGLDGLQHVAHTGFLAELDWTPALTEQAIGRLRRLGQKNTVTIYRPIAKKNGLDGRIISRLDKKKEVIDNIIKQTVVTINNVIEECKEFTMTEDQIERLIAAVERVADTIAAQVVVSGLKDEVQNLTTKAPKAKKAKEAVAEEVADALEVPAEPEPQLMTHKEAEAIITAEVKSDVNKLPAKSTAYHEYRNSLGYTSLSQVPQEKLEGFCNAVLAILQSPEVNAAQEFSA